MADRASRPRLPQRAKWLEHALQGLAFWIGHRHSLFRHYPLPEGALVAEACNLIQANLPDNLVLFPERQYRHLTGNGEPVPGFGPLIRADLVVCDSQAKATGRAGDMAQRARFVIEVKRASAGPGEIDQDLRRLHALLTVAGPTTRGFLLIVSESRAPERFVKDGKSSLGRHDIEGTDGHYRVRRTVKAAASFSGKKSAHYACLIEVFLRGQPTQEIH